MKREIPARDLFTHFTPVQSVWGDMDSLGHVNNVLYFRYSETARLNYMSDLVARVPGLDERMWTDQGMILADIGCSYLRQLHAPADLEVGTRIARIGGKTLNYQQGIYLAGENEPVAVTDAVVVWFNYQTQSSIEVPEEVRAAICGLENTPPDQS